MILVLLLVLSQFFNSTSLYVEESDRGITVVDSSNIYESTNFYHDNLFGIAGGFHLVGLDSVKNNAHVHGNILTNKLIYGSNFGTAGYEEVSYAKDIIGGGSINAIAHQDSVLVVGQDVKIDLIDNGNAWAINGTKVDNPNKQKSPHSLWQDGDQVFIDFSKVKQQTESLANELSNLAHNATEINNTDQNNQEIMISASDDFNVYHLDANDFNFSTPIHIKGFNKDQITTLIINVDMNNMPNEELFSIPNSVAHYTDGSKVSTGGVTEWSNANVVWNIYNSSNENNIYNGVIENNGAVTGSILSPGATINLKNNLNGTVIAKDIVVTGETHRDDYVNIRKSEPETRNINVEKVWDGKAQDSVTINLLADGVKVDSVDLSEANDWKHVFTDLPTVHDIADEEAIEYTVEEVAIDGYDITITGDAQSGFTITNKEVVEKSMSPEKGTPAKDTSDTSVTSDEKLLPNTATDIFNYLLIGLILLVLGGLSYYLYHKKIIRD